MRSKPFRSHKLSSMPNILQLDWKNVTIEALSIVTSSLRISSCRLTVLMLFQKLVTLALQLNYSQGNHAVSVLAQRAILLQRFWKESHTILSAMCLVLGVCCLPWWQQICHFLLKVWKIISLKHHLRMLNLLIQSGRKSLMKWWI